ncbi:MAG: hypothetical protein GY761_11590 [Hyphomicrobiales bacterium]|nr:hypothetical protein [Hyphomicrobiales bacterium]
MGAFDRMEAAKSLAEMAQQMRAEDGKIAAANGRLGVINAGKAYLDFQVEFDANLHEVLGSSRAFGIFGPNWAGKFRTIRETIEKVEDRLAKLGLKPLEPEEKAKITKKADDINFYECFPAETSITLAEGTAKNINQMQLNDIVLAYDQNGVLQPARVIRLFENLTQE